ncbi:MAG: prolyl oligopeptidase family serine peptidase [Spirochaetes bacterium]|nr:prolyl oligopeptidase family serine peptidase [Spirochaetota bacterium]
MKVEQRVFREKIEFKPDLNYLLYLPTDYQKDPHKKWPLMLFLHGSEERGDEVTKVKRNGLPKIIEQGMELPFVVVAPQCPKNKVWDLLIRELDALLHYIEKKYAIDHKRVCLTGLSMGGTGCWHFSVLYPDRFAAIIPICGSTSGMLGFPERAGVLKHVPIWVFHGQKDDVVPVNESRMLVNTLRQCKGKVKFTIYSNAYHDSWSRTYKNKKLYEWLLDQISKSS